jgi:hypothetical protein
MRNFRARTHQWRLRAVTLWRWCRCIHVEEQVFNNVARHSATAVGYLDRQIVYATHYGHAYFWQVTIDAVVLDDRSQRILHVLIYSQRRLSPTHFQQLEHYVVQMCRDGLNYDRFALVRCINGFYMHRRRAHVISVAQKSCVFERVYKMCARVGARTHQ